MTSREPCRLSRSEGHTRLYANQNLERLEVILKLTRSPGVNLACARPVVASQANSLIPVIELLRTKRSG
jgi:DNA-binding transcriptional MerR regulator